MSDQSQQFPLSDLGDPRSTDSTLGGGRTSRRRPASGSSQVEAELAAIFGEDELLRHPPDPFEEKILTGRNSFTDLRDQLAQEDQGETQPSPRRTPSRPRDTTATASTTPRPRDTTTPRPRPETTPRPRPTTSRDSETTSRVRPTSDPQSRIAELRRNLGEGTSSRTPSTPAPSAEPGPRSRFFHDEPGTTTPSTTRRTTPPPSDAEDRISALRRDLANRRAAAAEAAEESARPRPSRTEEPTATRVPRPRPTSTEEPAIRTPRTEPVRPRTPRTEEPIRPRPTPVAEEFESLRPSRTEEPQRRPRTEEPGRRPRTEESVRPRLEPAEEPVRPRPTRTVSAPRPRPVDLVDEEIVEAPVRERRPARQPAPIIEEPVEEYTLFEEPVELEPPRKTRAPKAEPVAEFVEPAFIAPEVELEPEPVVERPAPEKRRSKTLPAAPPAAAPAPVRKPSAPLAPSSGDLAVVSQVTKTYSRGGHVEALRGVSLSVPQGRMTVIMGRSGAGKSTLLYCMAGLEAPTSGTVTVAGQALTDMKERQLDKFRRDNVGFVFREFNLLPSLNVADNIKLGLSVKKQSLDQGWYEQVVSTLNLNEVLTKKPADLSASEQQRVAIARALITKPSLIIADEPTGNLDSQAANEVLTVLHDAVTGLGQTVVVATHDAACAANADQVWVLDDGTVVEQIKSPTLTRVIDSLRSVSGGSAA